MVASKNVMVASKNVMVASENVMVASKNVMVAPKNVMVASMVTSKMLCWPLKSLVEGSQKRLNEDLTSCFCDIGT